MYRETGIERGYEDAIPVKRSRRSEKIRNEARREAAERKSSVDFNLSRSDINTRSIPAKPSAVRTVPKKRTAAGTAVNTPIQRTAAAEPAVKTAVASPAVKPVAKTPVAGSVAKVHTVNTAPSPAVNTTVKTPAARTASEVLSANTAAKMPAPESSPAVKTASRAPAAAVRETATPSVTDVTKNSADPVQDRVIPRKNTAKRTPLKDSDFILIGTAPDINIPYVNPVLTDDTDGIPVRGVPERIQEREPSVNMRTVNSVLTGVREDYTEEFEKETEREIGSAGLTAGKIVRRSLLSIFTALVLAVGAVFGACYTVAVGPSETVRNILVLSALQASATKWVPGLFLDDAVVEQILEDSRKVNTDSISVEDYYKEQTEEGTDKWENAIDGMIYETISGPTFKGYVLLIKDPSRVSVGVATDNFTNDTEGMRIFDMAEKYGAVAAINGGEYPDAGGMGIGGRPIGLTYSDGVCVWSDGLRRSFMGFDENDRLIVREGLTEAEAEELGIRDGVCFQTGKTLITNEDGNITMYYADNDTGTAQRTAIGQAADGTVILLVTDGRTASSLGATHNDVIDVMVSYGAVSAGMLDGGSSSLMYYKDYYDKYDIDKSSLDEYQQKGLINKYKAFTTPRRLPTCFIVAPE